jgi:serine/threonine protein kinase
MGEVYRARDTNLGREVAIKVLRSSFARDPDRLRRVEREARLLATLNHPHIGAIYGLEETDGVRALVLELIEGPTIADWIPKPTGTGTWLATSANGVRLIDFERRTTLWEKPFPGTGLSLPMFSPDGRSISFPHQESRDRDAISILETATGSLA